MDDVIEFVIDLPPVVASRPRAVRGRGAYYLPKYDQYRKDMAVVLGRVLREHPNLGDSPVEVWVHLVCHRPKKPANPWPHGDFDNFVKATTDALTKAGLWDDDDQVVDAHIRKRYAKPDQTPHTRVIVRPLDPDDL